MLQRVTSADAIFELISVILAMAGARSRYVAYICRDTRVGTSTPQASQVSSNLAFPNSQACAPVPVFVDNRLCLAEYVKTSASKRDSEPGCLLVFSHLL